MSERLASKPASGSAATNPPHLIERPSGSETGRLRQRVESLRLPAELSAGRRSGAVLPWLLILVLGAAVGWLSYRLYTISATPSSAAGPAPLVDDAPVAADQGEVALESKGYIIPAHQILITPQVNGRVEKLFIEEGRRVARGDVLAELEKTDYLADVARSEAQRAAAFHKLSELERGNRPEEIEQTKAELAENEAQREQLYAEYQRNLRLRPTKTVSDMDFEKSESAFRSADQRVVRLKNALKLMIEGPRQERIDLARAELKQAEAELTKSKWRLEQTTIRAPISGTILKKNAEEGNIVNPVAFNGSYSLCEMADLADLEVDLAIQERDISQVRQGQRCRVKAEAWPDRVYEGVVSRLMPIADRAKGAVPVRVKVTVPAAEEGVYLKPEMGVLVSFLHSGNAEKKP